MLRGVESATYFSAFLGAGFLFAFYRGVEHSWPGSYFQFDTTSDPIVSRSPFRYLMFRLAPVFFVGLFVAVTLERFKQSSHVGVVLLFAVYSFGSNGIGIFRTLQRSSKNGLRIARLSFQIAMVVMIGVTLIAAYLCRKWLAPIVPQPSDISVAIWTGVAVATLGGFLSQVTEPSNSSIAKLARRSYGEINRETIDVLKSECAKHGTEFDLALAVLLVENLQRPLWARRIEHAKSLVFRKGSYGVMQVVSDRWIDDNTSVQRAIELYLAGQFIGRNEYGTSHPDSIRTALLTFNRDADYFALVESMYDALPEAKLAKTLSNTALPEPTV